MSAKNIQDERSQPADSVTDLAVERTALALERTQLAWVRTVMGFITAGIAIDKGLEALHEARLITGTAWSTNGHFSGELLTVSATALMIFTTVNYIRRTRQLNKMRGIINRFPPPTTILSIFVCCLGVLVVWFLHRT
jgi:uncharacterized membrane protein YidH (DUF202 family)